MKLIERINIGGNDFQGTYECEFCENQQNNPYGYNDYNYFKNVIPSMTCESCKKSSMSGVSSKEGQNQ